MTFSSPGSMSPAAVIAWMVLWSPGSLAAQEAGAGALFTEITEEAGVRFRHVNGASGEKYYVETMGSGACWLDYDGDGDIDLYAVNSAALPGYTGEGTPTNHLFMNEGDGRFQDVTAEAGVGDPGYGMGCTAGDYDNDGDTDLYVTNFGPNVLYRNEGNGRFRDVTAEARVGDPRWGASAAFVDIDNDADLDLYVTNYVEFTLAINKYCGNRAIGYRAYCNPDEYAAPKDSLYRNEGDGSFQDIAEKAGVAKPDSRGLGVVFADFDDDGWQDAYVANDRSMNFLFRNGRDGTFEDVSFISLTAFSESGQPQAGMGTDTADVDGDGRLDLIVTNLDHETNELYLNQGNMRFTNATFRSGLGSPSFLTVGFGTDFLDFDNDGDKDLLVANGHVIDNVHMVQELMSYEQPRKMLVNDGTGRFEALEEGLGEAFSVPNVGRGLAVGDMDNDGDLDFFVVNSNREAQLFRNEGIGPGGRRIGNWLLINLRGVKSNRDGVGARVRVSTAGPSGAERWQVEVVKTGSSYMSQNDMRLHFGLGPASRAETVEIRWPSGIVQTREKVAANQMVTIVEAPPEGTEEPR